MVPSQIQLELDCSQVGDFNEFVEFHGKVDSFQKSENLFFLDLVDQEVEEYNAFLKGLKEIYEVSKLKEVSLCQAKCKNGSKCLNHVQAEGCCWKHVKDIQKINILNSI